MNLDGWPPVAGRYYIGNKASPVSICTLRSIDLLEKFNSPEYLDKVAIVGKDVTENIGLEKIVLNVVSNPNIKFLILCGQESFGHEVGQAIISLINNGVDDNGKIIEAKGPMPVVKNLEKKQIENFRKQIKIVDLIGCEDMEKIMSSASNCENSVSEKIEAKPMETKTEEKVEEIIASYNSEKEFRSDQSGYFIISIKPETKEIIVEHYDYLNKLQHIIKGKTAEEISNTIIRLNLVSMLSHAAYLGRELLKAEQAIKNNQPYEQEKG